MQYIESTEFACLVDLIQKKHPAVVKYACLSALHEVVESEIRKYSLKQISHLIGLAAAETSLDVRKALSNM